MLLRSHGGGNCSGDGGAHEGGPDLHHTGLGRVYIVSIVKLDLATAKRMYPRDTRPEFKMWGGASKTSVINLSTSI